MALAFRHPDQFDAAEIKRLNCPPSSGLAKIGKNTEKRINHLDLSLSGGWSRANKHPALISRSDRSHNLAI